MRDCLRALRSAESEEACVLAPLSHFLISLSKLMNRLVHVASAQMVGFTFFHFQ